MPVTRRNYKNKGKGKKNKSAQSRKNKSAASNHSSSNVPNYLKPGYTFNRRVLRPSVHPNMMENVYIPPKKTMKHLYHYNMNKYIRNEIKHGSRTHPEEPWNNAWNQGMMENHGSMVNNLVGK